MGRKDETEIELNLPFPSSTLEMISLPDTENRLSDIVVEGKIVGNDFITVYAWDIIANYLLGSKRPHAWWAVYRGFMPAYANCKNYIHSDLCSTEQGTINFNYVQIQEINGNEGHQVLNQGKSQENSIFTLALFVDETKDECRLTDFVTFRLPFIEPISGFDIITDVTITPPDNSAPADVDFQCKLSSAINNQWWALYKGAIPSWINLNMHKEKWDWITNAEKDRDTFIVTNEVAEAMEGEIYTLLLYRDIEKNNYDIGDCRIFRILKEETSSANLLSNIRVTTQGIKFEYRLSDVPYYQWWVIYKGVMPSYEDLNRDKIIWDWFSNTSKNNRKGEIDVSVPLEKNGIYTLALFIDSSRNQYSLGDFKLFRT